MIFRKLTAISTIIFFTFTTTLEAANGIEVISSNLGVQVESETDLLVQFERHMTQFFSSKVTRRQLFRYAGIGAAGLSSRPVHAGDGYRELPEGGVEVDGARINSFIAYSEATHDDEEKQVLDVIAAYIKQHAIIRNRALSASAKSDLDTLKSNTVESLQAAGPSLERFVVSDLSDNLVMRWEQLFYQALPQYLAEKGILFIPWFNSYDTPPRNGRLPEDRDLITNYELLKVEDVVPVTLEIWGETVESNEIHVRESVPYPDDPQIFDMGHTNRGKAVYGNIVLYLDNIGNDIAGTLEEYRQMRVGLSNVVEIDWYPGNPDAEDPLYYGALQHMKKLLDTNITRVEEEERIYTELRYHELRHIQNQRKSRGYQGHVPLNSWEAYDNVQNREHVLTEIDSELTAIRFSNPRNRKTLFLSAIARAYSPNYFRLDRLFSYNLLTLFVDRFEERYEKYSEIVVSPNRPGTVRQQIAWQFYRLTDEHFVEILDAVHDSLEKIYEEDGRESLQIPMSVDMSQVTSRKISRLEAPTWFNKWTGLILLALGIIVFYFWQKRTKKLKRLAVVSHVESVIRGLSGPIKQKIDDQVRERIVEILLTSNRVNSDLNAVLSQVLSGQKRSAEKISKIIRNLTKKPSRKNSGFVRLDALMVPVLVAILGHPFFNQIIREVSFYEEPRVLLFPQTLQGRSELSEPDIVLSQPLATDVTAYQSTAHTDPYYDQPFYFAA